MKRIFYHLSLICICFIIANNFTSTIEEAVAQNLTGPTAYDAPTKTTTSEPKGGDKCSCVVYTQPACPPCWKMKEEMGCVKKGTDAQGYPIYDCSGVGDSGKYDCLDITFVNIRNPGDHKVPRFDTTPRVFCGGEDVGTSSGSVGDQNEECGCEDPKAGSCVCKKYLNGQRGYSCVKDQELPEEVDPDVFPGCDKVDECDMTYEECDALPPKPPACHKLECKEGRWPKCKFIPDPGVEPWECCKKGSKDEACQCAYTEEKVCEVDPLPFPTAIDPEGGFGGAGGDDTGGGTCRIERKYSCGSAPACCGIADCKDSEFCKKPKPETPVTPQPEVPKEVEPDKTEDAY